MSASTKPPSRDQAIADQSLTVALRTARRVVATTAKFGNSADARSIIDAERGRVQLGQVLVDALDLEAQAGGEVFLVAEHHVDTRGQTAVDLAGTFHPAEPLPETGPVVEVVGDDGAVPRSGLDGLLDHVGSRLRERRRRCRRVWNQRTPSVPNRCSQSTSPGRSCEAAVLPRSETPSAPRTPNPRSVKLSPFRTVRPIPSYGTQRHQRRVDPALEDEVLDQPPDVVVGEGGDEGRPHPEAAA